MYERYSEFFCHMHNSTQANLMVSDHRSICACKPSLSHTLTSSLTQPEILQFLRQNRFDGLDLDWEYPAFRDGAKPKDRENYAKLVRELREEFEREAEKTGKPRLLLTMAVPAGIEYIQKGFDVKTLNQLVF